MPDVDDFKTAKEAFEKERDQMQALQDAGARHGDVMDAFVRSQEHFTAALEAGLEAMRGEPSRPTLTLVKAEDDA
jgi:hypothetical protein